MKDERKKLHRGLVDDGDYTKTYDDFNAKFSDEGNRKILYDGLIKDKKYTNSYVEFNEKYFSDLKKKDKISGATGKVSATVSEGVALETPSISKPEIPPAVPELVRQMEAVTPEQVEETQQQFVDYTSFKKLSPELQSKALEKKPIRTEGELAKIARDEQEKIDFRAGVLVENQKSLDVLNPYIAEGKEEKTELLKEKAEIKRTQTISLKKQQDVLMEVASNAASEEEYQSVMGQAEGLQEAIDNMKPDSPSSYIQGLFRNVGLGVAENVDALDGMSVMLGDILIEGGEAIGLGYEKKKSDKPEYWQELNKNYGKAAKEERPLWQLSNWMKGQSKQWLDNPNTVIGRAVGSVEHIMGSFGLGIGVLKGVTGLASVPSMFAYMTGSGGFRAYGEAENEGKPIFEKFKEYETGALKGAKDAGILYMLSGVSGKLGQAVIKGTKKPILGEISSHVSLAGLFGGETAAEQILEYGEVVDWDGVYDAGATGLALGGKDIATKKVKSTFLKGMDVKSVPKLSELEQLKILENRQEKMWGRWLSSTPENEIIVRETKSSPIELRKKAFELREEAGKETNKQKQKELILAAKVADGIADNKIINQSVVDNSAEIIKNVKESNESPEAKNLIIDKVNKTVAEDTKAKTGKTTDEINDLENQKQVIEENTYLDDSVKKVETDKINEELKVKQEELSNKLYPEAKPLETKEPIKPKEEPAKPKEEPIKPKEEPIKPKEELSKTISEKEKVTEKKEPVKLQEIKEKELTKEEETKNDLITDVEKYNALTVSKRKIEHPRLSKKIRDAGFDEQKITSYSTEIKLTKEGKKVNRTSLGEQVAKDYVAISEKKKEVQDLYETFNEKVKIDEDVLTGVSFGGLSKSSVKKGLKDIAENRPTEEAKEVLDRIEQWDKKGYVEVSQGSGVSYQTKDAPLKEFKETLELTKKKEGTEEGILEIVSENNRTQAESIIEKENITLENIKEKKEELGWLWKTDQEHDAVFDSVEKILKRGEKYEKGKEQMAEGLDDIMSAFGGKLDLTGEKRTEVVDALKKIASGAYDMSMVKVSEVYEKVREWVDKNITDPTMKGEILALLNKNETKKAIKDEFDIKRDFAKKLETKPTKTEIQKDIEKTVEGKPKELIQEYEALKIALTQPEVYKTVEKAVEADVKKSADVWLKMQELDIAKETKDKINKITEKYKKKIEATRDKQKTKDLWKRYNRDVYSEWISANAKELRKLEGVNITSILRAINSPKTTQEGINNVIEKIGNIVNKATGERTVSEGFKNIEKRFNDILTVGKSKNIGEKRKVDFAVKTTEYAEIIEKINEYIDTAKKLEDTPEYSEVLNSKREQLVDDAISKKEGLEKETAVDELLMFDMQLQETGNSIRELKNTIEEYKNTPKKEYEKRKRLFEEAKEKMDSISELEQASLKSAKERREQIKAEIEERKQERQNVIDATKTESEFARDEMINQFDNELLASPKEAYDNLRKNITDSELSKRKKEKFIKKINVVENNSKTITKKKLEIEKIIGREAELKTKQVEPVSRFSLNVAKGLNIPFENMRGLLEYTVRDSKKRAEVMKLDKDLDSSYMKYAELERRTGLVVKQMESALSEHEGLIKKKLIGSKEKRGFFTEKKDLGVKEDILTNEGTVVTDYNKMSYNDIVYINMVLRNAENVKIVEKILSSESVQDLKQHCENILNENKNLKSLSDFMVDVANPELYKILNEPYKRKFGKDMFNMENYIQREAIQGQKQMRKGEVEKKSLIPGTVFNRANPREIKLKGVDIYKTYRNAFENATKWNAYGKVNEKWNYIYRNTDVRNSIKKHIPFGNKILKSMDKLYANYPEGVQQKYFGIKLLNNAVISKIVGNLSLLPKQVSSFANSTTHFNKLMAENGNIISSALSEPLYALRLADPRTYGDFAKAFAKSDMAWMRLTSGHDPHIINYLKDSPVLDVMQKYSNKWMGVPLTVMERFKIFNKFLKEIESLPVKVGDISAFIGIKPNFDILFERYQKNMPKEEARGKAFEEAMMEGHRVQQPAGAPHLLSSWQIGKFGSIFPYVSAPIQMGQNFREGVRIAFSKSAKTAERIAGIKQIGYYGYIQPLMWKTVAGMFTGSITAALLRGETDEFEKATEEEFEKMFERSEMMDVAITGILQGSPVAKSIKETVESKVKGEYYRNNSLVPTLQIANEIVSDMGKAIKIFVDYKITSIEDFEKLPNDKKNAIGKFISNAGGAATGHGTPSIYKYVSPFDKKKVYLTEEEREKRDEEREKEEKESGEYLKEFQ